MTEPEADDTEAVWREIVENYGDRPVIEPAPEPADESHVEPREPSAGLGPSDDVFDYDDARFEYEEPDEDRFIPPVPAPMPRARPDRLAAWLGVLGSPAVVLVLLLSGLSVDPVIGWLLVAAFVGGFGYLVATMPREPRDPWDDGAKL